MFFFGGGVLEDHVPLEFKRDSLVGSMVVGGGTCFSWFFGPHVKEPETGMKRSLCLGLNSCFLWL